MIGTWDLVSTMFWTIKAGTTKTANSSIPHLSKITAMDQNCENCPNTTMTSELIVEYVVVLGT